VVTKVVLKANHSVELAANEYQIGNTEAKLRHDNENVDNDLPLRAKGV
jgi:hypothetical protein